MSIESLAQRIRDALKDVSAVTERRMFGGVAFMVNGNLALSASPNGLLVRVGDANMATALKRKGARPMTNGKRVMTGYLFVDEDGSRSASDFRYWINSALEEIRTLPGKSTPAKQTAAGTTKRRVKT